MQDRGCHGQVEKSPGSLTNVSLSLAQTTSEKATFCLGKSVDPDQDCSRAVRSSSALYAIPPFLLNIQPVK